MVCKTTVFGKRYTPYTYNIMTFCRLLYNVSWQIEKLVCFLFRLKDWWKYWVTPPTGSSQWSTFHSRFLSNCYTPRNISSLSWSPVVYLQKWDCCPLDMKCWKIKNRLAELGNFWVDCNFCETFCEILIPNIFSRVFTIPLLLQMSMTCLCESFVNCNPWA